MVYPSAKWLDRCKIIPILRVYPREAKERPFSYPVDSSASTAIPFHSEQKDFPICVLKPLPFLHADCALSSNLKNQVNCCCLSAVFSIDSSNHSFSPLVPWESHGTYHTLLCTIFLYYIPPYKIVLSSSRAMNHFSFILVSPPQLAQLPHP